MHYPDYQSLPNQTRQFRQRQTIVYHLKIAGLLACILFLAGCQVTLDEISTTARQQIDSAIAQSATGVNARSESNTQNNRDPNNSDPSSGPIRIIGQVSYTSPYFYLDNPDPYITLYNIAPFYSDEAPTSYDWIRKAQQLGMVTSTPYTSPFTYQLLLPTQPAGPYTDFDTQDDGGIGLYTVNLISNVWGDPFLNFEYGDSLSSMSSVVWGYDAEYGNVLIGGSVVIYAPDAEQEFPIAYGADGILFTPDDPLAPLQQGYTVVQIDSEPFQFRRSHTTTIDILEPEEAERIDFTSLTYSDAFDRLIDLMRKEYAYTDHYDIDWAGLDPTWRQRIVEAENAADYEAYTQTLYDFVRTFADGHVAVEFEEYPAFVDLYDGSVGIVVQETARGEVFITDVIPELPADEAGIKIGAKLLAIDSLTPADAIAATNPYYPAGLPNAAQWRLEQMKYVERGELGSQVTLRYRNPDESEEKTDTLTRVFDWRGPYRGRFYDPIVPERPLPVEFDLLPSGYGHIKIYSFLDDKKLTLALWNRAIDTLNREEIAGVVLDMRQNEGGTMFLAELMASYFFDRNVGLGAFTYYDAEVDEFPYDSESQRIMYPIPSELHYSGKIVVLIGPDCNSACEFFSYALEQKEETQTLGYYGSAGLGGAVELVYMPDGVIVNFTIGRAVDAQGNIHIEGMGVQPDVRVPITREAVLSKGDSLLRAAEIALNLSTMDD